MTNSKQKKIAFQGEIGANSDMACHALYPNFKSLPCPTFEDAFNALNLGKAELAMIPIENTLAGRVADIHYLLPRSNFHIIEEYYMPIHFHLMVIPGTKKEEVESVCSHVHAIGQCRKIISQNGWETAIVNDTAGAARQISQNKDKSRACLSPPLAAELYGLDVLEKNVEDHQSNTTRFIVLSRDELKVARKSDNETWITTLIFRVRDLPSALYKCIAGFATNGINVTKLESYQTETSFATTEFYADIQGHPDDKNVKQALAELEYFSEFVNILGVYLGHSMRTEKHFEHFSPVKKFSE